MAATSAQVSDAELVDAGHFTPVEQLMKGPLVSWVTSTSSTNNTKKRKSVIRIAMYRGRAKESHKYHVTLWRFGYVYLEISKDLCHRPRRSFTLDVESIPILLRAKIPAITPRFSN